MKQFFDDQVIKICAHGLFAICCITISLPAFSHKIVKSDAIIITTDNQKYDFVMRPNPSGSVPPPPEGEARLNEQILANVSNTMGRRIIDPRIYDPLAEIKARASQYPASGLYLHGSKVPIWTVGWHEVDLVVAEDGHHLARMAWNYGSDMTHPAIIFYEDGKEIRSWSMRELVDNNPLCLLKEGWYFGLDQKGHSGDEVRISTRRGQTVIFNLTTGVMIERTLSDCHLQMPNLFDIRLWNPITHGLREEFEKLEGKEHQMNRLLALVVISFGIIIVLLHSKKEYMHKRLSDD